jgi:hypothetical protein
MMSGYQKASISRNSASNLNKVKQLSLNTISQNILFDALVSTYFNESLCKGLPH